MAFRFVAANDHPNHDTIATSRRRFLKAIEGLFGQLLELARRRGRFTDEPVNLSVVKGLNMMDDLVKIYNSKFGENLVLSQNSRLTHRAGKIGDFIAAFLDVVTSEDVGRVKKTGIA